MRDSLIALCRPEFLSPYEWSSHSRLVKTEELFGKIAIFFISVTFAIYSRFDWIKYAQCLKIYCIRKYKAPIREVLYE